jgi:hypothetical protein
MVKPREDVREDCYPRLNKALWLFLPSDKNLTFMYIHGHSYSVPRRTSCSEQAWRGVVAHIGETINRKLELFDSTS